MSATAITGIDVHTYQVKDAARAKAFYRDVLGLTQTDDDPQGAEFALPDGSTFGIWQMDGGEWKAGTGVMFAVPDFHAAVEHYRARGFEIVHVEETPVCFMGFGSDTEGNEVILHQRKPQAE